MMAKTASKQGGVHVSLPNYAYRLSSVPVQYVCDQKASGGDEMVPSQSEVFGLRS